MESIVGWIVQQFAGQLRSPEPNSFMGWFAMKLMEGNFPSIRKGMDRMDLQSSDIFVELGAGHGVGLQHILQQDEQKIPQHIHCVEISPEFRSKLHQLLSDESNKKHRVSIHSNDCRDLTFLENDSVDKVFAMNVVYFLDPLDVYLKELYRILKPEGVLVFGCKFANVPKDSNVFVNIQEDAIVEAMENAGFHVTSTFVQLGEKKSQIVDYTELRGIKKD